MLAAGCGFSPTQAEESLLQDPLRASTVLTRPGHTEATTNPFGAQAVPGPVCPALAHPLTLESAVTQALCRNPQTAETWAGVQAAVANTGAARGAYLPTLTANAALNRSRTTTNGLTTAGPATTWGPGVTLSLLLLDFGGRSATLAATTQALLAADFTHNATLQSVMYTVLQKYYALAAAMAKEDAAIASETSAATAYKAAQTRVKVGAATPVEELQAKSTWAQARLTRRQAEQTRETAAGTLLNTLGLSPEGPVTLALPPHGKGLTETDAQLDKNLTPLLNLARKRPDVAAAFANLKKARAEVTAAESAGRPTLNGTASFANTTNLTGAERRTGTAAAGLTLTVPLFSGFTRTYQVHAAERQADAAEAVATAALNNALLDVWTTHAAYKSAKDTRRMTQDLLASSTAAEKLALGRYKAGVGTITELLSAESQLASARQQAAEAEFTLVTSRADLLRAAGALSPGALGSLTHE